MARVAGGSERLAGSDALTSPYLERHRTDAVGWYRWGEEAIARAREEDRPIFLSVGYATCHWCHAMAAESFADRELAAIVGEHFVPVLLDRQEHPEVDEIYMAATQLLTHRGGWPNTVFLTPRLEPYFAGTYFPPEDRSGVPSFRNVALSMADAWQNRRDDVEAQAAELDRVMGRYLGGGAEPGGRPPAASVAVRALAGLEERFDPDWGGFGRGPKFPTPAALHLLDELAPESDAASRMLAVTLERMARGAVHDHLGGGFHRHATDREWRQPSFEKVLPDNGHLLELYARHHARTGDAEAARVARGIATFLGRELTAPEGGLWSAVDADVAGREGEYYVWTVEGLAAALGAEDAGFLAPILGYHGAPMAADGSYALHLPEPLEEQARRRRMSRGELLAELEPLLDRLRRAREERPKPPVDELILTDWNGTAVRGLAVAGRLLDEPALVERAAAAARFVLGHLRVGDGGDSDSATLGHCRRGETARHPALFADYAELVSGLLALHDATGEEGWLAEAVRLTEEQVDRLGDPAGGFFTAPDRPDLRWRSKPIFDGNLPAANAVAVLNLMELASRTGDRRWLEQAEAALAAFATVAEEQTDAVRMLAVAVHRYHRRAG